MPRNITDTEPKEHFALDLHDYDELGAPVTITAEKIVDITDICLETIYNLGQTVLKYASSRQGVIVQLQERFDLGIDAGFTAHFYPDNLGEAGLATDSVFITHALSMGCDEITLVQTIFEHMPANENH